MPQSLFHRATFHLDNNAFNKRMQRPNAFFTAPCIMPQLPNDQEALHCKIVNALSPSSGLFGVIWPAIIDQASFGLRTRTLQYVCHYFNDLAIRSPRRRSDRAKLRYMAYYGNAKVRPGLPYFLDIPKEGLEWRCWARKRCEISAERFLQFCALGDIDVTSGASWEFNTKWDLRTGLFRSYTRWIWLSRTADIVMEASESPYHEPYIHHCQFIGITGRADKVIAMYDFLLKETEAQASDADWDEMLPGTD